MSSPWALASSGSNRKYRLARRRTGLTVTALIAETFPLRCQAATIGVSPLGA